MNDTFLRQALKKAMLRMFKRLNAKYQLDFPL